jgi:arginine metabolism regulation protein II
MASTIQDHAIDSNSRPPYIVTMSNNANLSKIPSEARHLLSYYSERIIDVMSMSTTNKPPWKTIHLPCAMGAFADLVVHGEGRSLARMSLFYALLSISSFHIGFASEDGNSRYWRDRGELHKKTSESYLTLALRNDMPKSARGKYKELLMSGLSMVTIGVSFYVLYSGSPF